MIRTKKISYLSSLVLIVASTIGAGIFFKNRELAQMSHGDMLLIIGTWLIATIGIVALGMALIEVTSAQKLKRGMLGWTKMFCPKWFHSATINYQKYFFLPVSLFALSLYVTSTFVEAGLKIHHPLFVLLISFLIFCFFMFINIISLKVAEMSQWITTLIQLIPLIILPIISLINTGNVGPDSTILQKNITPDDGIVGVSKWIVLVGGMPAIFFAYDGFYTVAELRNDLKAPKKIGKSLMWGLILVTIVYLFLTIAFNLGSSDGTHNGILGLSSWAKKFFNICIAVGIMGIINGYAMAAPRLYQNLIKHQEAKDLMWLHKLIFKNDNSVHKQFISSWIYLFVTTMIFFIIFGLIGVFIPFGNWDESVYGDGGKLYELADLLLNYSSLLIFVIITTAILGALINRKTKRIVVKKVRFFKMYSIIAIFMFYFSLLFVIVSALINATGFNNANVGQEIIKLTIFLGVIIIVLIPPLFQSWKKQSIKIKSKH